MLTKRIRAAKHAIAFRKKWYQDRILGRVTPGREGAQRDPKDQEMHDIVRPHHDDRQCHRVYSPSFPLR